MTEEPISKEFLDAFQDVVKTGNETQAREFLITHLKEFPKETQDTIIMAFFEEALEKKNEEDGLIADFQKRGLEKLDALGKIKEELEKHAKLAEIKENL